MTPLDRALAALDEIQTDLDKRFPPATYAGSSRKAQTRFEGWLHRELEQREEAS